MKILYRWLLLCTLLLLFCSCGGKANYIYEDGYIYKLENNSEYVLYRANEQRSKILQIPSVIQSCPVVGIGEFAFSDNQTIEKIVFPDSITFVDQAAFIACRNVKSIYFGTGLQKIDCTSFADCYSLSDLTISPQNPYFYIKDNCLIDRKLFALILGGKTSKIPEEVLSIEANAFSERNVQHIDLPTNLEKIGDNAFSSSALEEIILPEQLKEIGKGTFAYTPLQKITIPNQVKQITKDLFWGCTRLEQIEIGTDVNEIDVSAFTDCVNLTSISISPENSTYYSNQNCIVERDTLRLVLCSNTCTIPSETRIIGTRAISATLTSSVCKNLVIPRGVRELEHDAISSATMESVYIPESVLKMSAHAIVLYQGTVYCEASEQPEGWDTDWLSTGKSNDVNVVWGYDFTQINAPEQQ